MGAGNYGVWHPIVFPALPLYCSSCRRLGHLPSKCKKHKTNVAAIISSIVDPLEAEKVVPPPAVQLKSKKVWRPAPLLGHVASAPAATFAPV